MASKNNLLILAIYIYLLTRSIKTISEFGLHSKWLKDAMAKSKELRAKQELVSSDFKFQAAYFNCRVGSLPERVHGIIAII